MRRRGIHRFGVVVFGLMVGVAWVEAADVEVGGISGGVSLPISLGALDGVVGLQFDLVASPTQVAVGYPQVDGTSDHVSDSRALGGDGTRRRVMVYSPTNAGLPVALDVQVPVTLLEGAPAGGPSIGLTNVVFTDAAGNAVPVSVVYPGIEAWRRAHFTEVELLDAAVVGDDRDPDGDGLVNLGEFFGGRLPKVADADGVPRSVVSGEVGSELLKVRFWKGKSGVDGLAGVLAEASFDLEGWASDGVSVEATGEETATSLELEARVEDDGSGRAFLRIGFRREE